MPMRAGGSTPAGHPGDALLMGVNARLDFVDDFSIEGGQVLRAATRNEAVVDDDFLVGPLSACIFEIRLNRWVRCHPSAFD